MVLEIWFQLSIHMSNMLAIIIMKKSDNSAWVSVILQTCRPADPPNIWPIVVGNVSILSSTHSLEKTFAISETFSVLLRSDFFVCIELHNFQESSVLQTSLPDVDFFLTILLYQNTSKPKIKITTWLNKVGTSLHFTMSKNNLLQTRKL